jgi:hypothetical protein
VINNVCDNALLEGYADGRETIGRDIIENVLERLDITPTDIDNVEPSDFNTWSSPHEERLGAAEGSHN